MFLHNYLCCVDTTQSIIAACAVLHNIAIQRNQRLIDSTTVRLTTTQLTSSKESKFCENGNRKRYPNEMSIMQEPMGLLERDHFIQKHF